MKKKIHQQLKCQFCSNPATHTVLIELREKPGPPLKENNVLYLVCDIHAVDNSFDRFVSYPAFKALCIEWSKVGVTLNKRFCSINILKLKEYDN